MKKIILSVIIFVTFFSININGVLANCPTGYNNNAGICVPGNTGLSEEAPRDILLSVSRWVFSLVGVLAVLMILVAGVMYLGSAGNERTQETAKRILIWSIIGLVIALLSWVILITVVGLLTGGVGSGGGNEGGFHFRVNIRG